MDSSKIRAEQIEAGRQAVAAEKTEAPGPIVGRLSVRRENGTAALHRSHSFATTNTAKKAPIPPKGHEAFLKALEASDAVVHFEKISSGTTVSGRVKHSDKYSVSIVDAGGQTRVIFKHDISEFFTTPRDRVEAST